MLRRFLKEDGGIANMPQRSSDERGFKPVF
jgi:hypothetical protein